jgi:hypothetical protein
MPHDLSITITATVVAWYAAVVATLSLGINGYVAWRDRSRVTVRAAPNYRVTPGTPYDATKKYISVRVANAGRRPVTITHVYFSHHHAEEYTALSDPLYRGPTELTEGKSATYLCSQEALDLTDIRAVIAVDATGREWKGKLSV